MQIRLICCGLMWLLGHMACQPAPQSKTPVVADSAAKAAVVVQPISATVDRQKLAVFAPLPKVMEDKQAPVTPEKISLGRMLYYDERLSKNHDISCNTCHDLANDGVDHLPVSKGHRGQTGRRNAPSVYQAAGHFAQFWDGRSPHVEHQATQPLTNPGEMAADDKRLLATLKSIPAYVNAFSEAFPKEKNPITVTNLGKAIGAFERKLLTPSRWDEYLEGNEQALNDDEKRGLNTFINSGCIACHSGAYLGGQMFQKAGLIKPWPNQTDLGRFEVTHQEADKMLFKVPSLRNVAKTAPYFHNGAVSTLKEAIHWMGEYQLGKDLTPQEVAAIEAFLHTLNGTIPMDFIKKPEMPKSTSQTPKPDPR